MTWAFFWLDTDGLTEMRCYNKSRQYALSLCNVRFRGTLRDTTHQATRHSTQGKLGWNNTSAQQTTVASLPCNPVALELTFVSGLDHRTVLSLALRSCHKYCFQLHCALRSQGLAHHTFQLQPLTHIMGHNEHNNHQACSSRTPPLETSASVTSR